MKGHCPAAATPAAIVKTGFLKISRLHVVPCPTALISAAVTGKIDVRKEIAK